MLLLFPHISISRLSECWSFQAGWCIHHLSQLLVLLSIKAINALLTWVITESHVSKYPPHPHLNFYHPPTSRVPGFTGDRWRDNGNSSLSWQLLSLWNAARLAHKCIQRKSTISWELGMSSVVIIIKSSRGSQAEDDGAVLPKIVRFICVFNTRFPTISAKSYCNKIYNIISKIAYIETWSVYTVKM